MRCNLKSLHDDTSLAPRRGLSPIIDGQNRRPPLPSLTSKAIPHRAILLGYARDTETPLRLPVRGASR
jgi:hypothetical protein